MQFGYFLDLDCISVTEGDNYAKAMIHEENRPPKYRVGYLYTYILPLGLSYCEVYKR